MVSRVGVRLEDVHNLQFRAPHNWPLESPGVLEANDEDALPVLRNNRASVQNPILDLIVQVLLEGLQDGAERAAPVMAYQILHVLQDKRFRLLVAEDAGYLEEQCTLSPVLKAVGPAKTLFLGNSRDREGLARKSGNKDVMVRNFVRVYASDVAERIFRKIGHVSLPGMSVPVGREYASAAGTLERQAHTSNSAKQVNERRR